MSAPTTFGPYLLYRRLAVGGMAEIFLAKHANGDGRWLALKVMLPHNAGNAEHESMFSDEARLLLSIHHPNIVSAFDFVRVDDRIAVALEFVQGNDLSILMRRLRETQTAVPIQIALEIGMGIAAGLHHAHTLIADDGEPLYLVHRDVSPENILLGIDGSIKIADFGVAKARGMQQIETKTGIIKGKLRYMAPEYATGNMQDVRSDIFSLALCLFELLTGAPAYDDSTLGPELVESIKYARIPALRTLRPECPPLLERLLLKALAVSPMDRFTTAESMRRALEKVAQQLPPTPLILPDFLTQMGLAPVLPIDDTQDLAPPVELEPTGQMSAASANIPIRVAKPELVSLTGYRQSISRTAAGETRTAAVLGHQHPSKTNSLVELELEFEAVEDSDADDSQSSSDSYDELGSAETSRLDANLLPSRPSLEPEVAKAAPIPLFEDTDERSVPAAPQARYAIAATSERVALEPTDAFAALAPTGAMNTLGNPVVLEPTGAMNTLGNPVVLEPTGAMNTLDNVQAMEPPAPDAPERTDLDVAPLHQPMMTAHANVIGSMPAQTHMQRPQPAIRPPQPSQNFSAPPSTGPKPTTTVSDDYARPTPPKYSTIFVKLAALGIFVIVAMMFLFALSF